MLTLFLTRRARARLRGRGALRTPTATARSSGTCSSAASTSRRRSSRPGSSRSRTATPRSTARSRPRRASSPLTACGRRSPTRQPGEPALGRRAPPERVEREHVRGVLPARRRPVRARDRDDLRGLPAPLRPAAAVRARTPERALLLGDYLYAHGLVRIAGEGDVRAGRRPRRADLGLRPASCGRRQRRRLGVGGDRRPPRHQRAPDERGPRCASAGTRSRSRSWRARRSADLAVDDALGAHEARVR